MHYTTILHSTDNHWKDIEHAFSSILYLMDFGTIWQADVIYTVYTLYSVHLIVVVVEWLLDGWWIDDDPLRLVVRSFARLADGKDDNITSFVTMTAVCIQVYWTEISAIVDCVVVKCAAVSAALFCNSSSSLHYSIVPKS